MKKKKRITLDTFFYCQRLRKHRLLPKYISEAATLQFLGEKGDKWAKFVKKETVGFTLQLVYGNRVGQPYLGLKTAKADWKASYEGEGGSVAACNHNNTNLI